MLYYDIIGISKGNDLAKCENNKECIICHYRFLIMYSTFKIMYVMVVMI